MGSITLTKPRILGIGHDDMLGEVRSSITGATVWDIAQINDTMNRIGSINEASD